MVGGHGERALGARTSSEAYELADARGAAARPRAGRGPAAARAAPRRGRRVRPSERLSLNQITTSGWSVAEAAEGCARAGIGWIGLWRDKVAETGARGVPARGARRGAAGLQPAAAAASSPVGDRARALDENRRAIEEAADARHRPARARLRRPARGLARPAGARGRWCATGSPRCSATRPPAACGSAIEPLHPMFCADRSVITTLDEATTLAQQFPAGQVGVVIDAYHVWWDPRVEEEIARAGRERRIFAFHIDDWVLPLPAGALHRPRPAGRGLRRPRRPAPRDRRRGLRRPDRGRGAQRARVGHARRRGAGPARGRGRRGARHRASVDFVSVRLTNSTLAGAGAARSNCGWVGKRFPRSGRDDDPPYPAAVSRPRGAGSARTRRFAGMSRKGSDPLSRPASRGLTPSADPPQGV